MDTSIERKSDKRRRRTGRLNLTRCTDSGRGSAAPGCSFDGAALGSGGVKSSGSTAKPGQLCIDPAIGGVPNRCGRFSGIRRSVSCLTTA